MKLLALLVPSLVLVSRILAAPTAIDYYQTHQTPTNSLRRNSTKFHELVLDFVGGASQEKEIGRRSTTFSTSQDGVDSAGFYYSLYNGNGADAGYTEFDDTGEFQIGWNLPNGTEFLGGKGFRDDSTRSLTWDGYFTAIPWRYPVTEWYIVESHGTGTPGNGNIIGTVTSDDSSYDVYDLYYADVTPIYGVSSFHQYWSVRQAARTTGTVDVTAHFDAWRSLGLDPGAPIFQMVTLEGFQGQGYLDFIVSS